jgi:two-component system response regulator HydG
MARLLIIDDDVDICSLLTRFLLKHGYEVEAVHAGNRGLEKLAENAFDLVLCDFRLQDTDGRELLKKIKSLYPKTSVIIITGYSDIKVFSYQYSRHGQLLFCYNLPSPTLF